MLYGQMEVEVLPEAILTRPHTYNMQQVLCGCLAPFVAWALKLRAFILRLILGHVEDAANLVDLLVDLGLWRLPGY